MIKDYSFSRLFVFGVPVLMFFGLAGCQKSAARQSHDPPTTQVAALPKDERSTSAREKNDGSVQHKSLADDWGITVLGVQLSAAGYMLDFRYKVTDPEKALPLMSRDAKTYLVDQETGAKLYVPSPPKVGQLRQKSSQPQVGRTYFILFANPGRFIKVGSKVTVAIGDCRIENLIVE
jgi:hypothetical protein